MNNNVNNLQAVVNAPLSKPEDNNRHDKGVSTVPNTRTVTIEDTTVRISFNDSGDLNMRLANAFQTMLKS